jgi:hypothetical protein
VNTEVVQDEQALREELIRARERLEDLVADRRAVDGELEGISGDRNRHEVLRGVCEGLDRLDELGAAELFWSDIPVEGDGCQHLRGVRTRLQVFFGRVNEIDRRREAIIESILQEQENIEYLEEDLFQAQQAEERRKLEWIVEREISALPSRQAVMPWTRGGSDDRRFRKSLLVSLAASVLVALIIPQIDLPLPEAWQPDEVPERLARLVQQKRPVPPPVSTIEEPEPEKPEPPPEPEVETELAPVEGPALAQSTPDPTPTPQPAAKKKRAASKGILAFREKFAGLADKAPGAKLGAQARISTSGDAAATGLPTRNMVSTQAPGSSGGINLASLSRDVGGGGGGQMSGVQLTRATSSIGGSGPVDRPLASGPGSSRTDEEIQIVFDRHKAALYRLYNRELRKNPTLKGQMVLKIRIEPDGSVTLCELQATDMNAPQLAGQVIERVRTFDFGAKDGIPPVVIVYPIDFLPAV